MSLTLQFALVSIGFFALGLVLGLSIRDRRRRAHERRWAALLSDERHQMLAIERDNVNLRYELTRLKLAMSARMSEEARDVRDR